MKILKLTLTLLFALMLMQAHASQKRKVLIIGIDGTRPDALQAAHTPNIDSLIAHGLYSFGTYHLGITWSGPSWSDIMCGVWEIKHGVQDNSYTGSNYTNYPYFPTHAKEIKPNLSCVQITEWAPMSDNVTNDGWDQKIIVSPDGGGTPTAAAAWTALADSNLDCMFVYFDHVDLTGHSSGFSASNPAYVQAISFVDSCVGLILDSLHHRPNYANEDWLILAITDHGGHSLTHGTNLIDDRQIWWIASGDKVKHHQLSGPDPGSYQIVPPGVDTTILDTTPVQTDIAVTALHHLIYDAGINPANQPAWALDGKSWLRTIYDTTTATAGIADIKPSLEISLFPNPSTGLFSIWFANPDGMKVYYTVTDMWGRTVKEDDKMSSKNKVNIDLADQSTGNYFITMHVGQQQVTKKVTVTH